MNRKIALNIFVSIVLLLLASTGYAAGDANAGKEKSAACTSCHGVNGKGPEPNPNIAGMNIGKFKTAMQEYKTGKRNNPMMQMFSKKLSDQDIEDLAAYYAGN